MPILQLEEYQRLWLLDRLFKLCLLFVDTTATEEGWHEAFIDVCHDFFLDCHCEWEEVLYIARLALISSHLIVHCTCRFCTQL